MKKIKNARIGIITILTAILVSMNGQLPARRLSSGTTTLAVAGIVLLVVAGGASADTLISSCDFHATTTNERYYLDSDLTCSAGEIAILVEADGVAIDGQGHKISGDLSGGGRTYGVYADEQDDLTIENLEVEQFDIGIGIKASWDSVSMECETYSDRPTIDNCKIHDCGETDVPGSHGIQFTCAIDGSITNCEVYGNTGNMIGGCGDSGAGIHLFGGSSNNIIDNNVIYGNRFAGIYSKARCKHCNAINNVVYENGVVTDLAYFGGGIRLQCKNTESWTIENNIITDNIGPGIFIGGNDCTVRDNTVTGNKDANSGQSNGRGDGLRNDRNADSGGKNTQLYDNVFCDNEHLDINVEAATQGVTGNKNTCDTTSNYNDDGTTGCTYPCSPQKKPDLVITEKSETFDGSTLEVTYTVANNGGGNAGASTTGISVGGTQVADDSVGALSAGASHTSTVTIGSDCLCGTTVTVTVCADKDSTVDEGDEMNNCRENTFNCPPCAADPTLCTSPDPPSHNFGSVQQGQTRTWTFNVTNCGGETLEWTMGDDQTWITVSPESGSATDETDTITVTIDTTGLTAGATHEGTLTVGSNDGTKTGTISVSIPSGQEDPLLCTNPDPPSHDFGNVQEGETLTWTFNVTNCGAGTLNWTVSDDQDWITVSPTSGSVTTDGDTVTVTVNTAGLSDGSHTVNVTVGSNGGTKTGTIKVYVEGQSVDVPTFTPIGILSLFGLLGIVAISSIGRGKSE